MGTKGTRFSILKSNQIDSIAFVSFSPKPRTHVHNMFPSILNSILIKLFF